MADSDKKTITSPSKNKIFILLGLVVVSVVVIIVVIVLSAKRTPIVTSGNPSGSNATGSNLLPSSSSVPAGFPSTLPQDGSKYRIVSISQSRGLTCQSPTYGLGSFLDTTSTSDNNQKWTFHLYSYDEDHTDRAQYIIEGNTPSGAPAGQGLFLSVSGQGINGYADASTIYEAVRISDGVFALNNVSVGKSMAAQSSQLITYKNYGWNDDPSQRWSVIAV